MIALMSNIYSSLHYKMYLIGQLYFILLSLFYKEIFRHTKHLEGKITEKFNSYKQEKLRSL